MVRNALALRKRRGAATDWRAGRVNASVKTAIGYSSAAEDQGVYAPHSPADYFFLFASIWWTNSKRLRRMNYGLAAPHFRQNDRLKQITELEGHRTNRKNCSLSQIPLDRRGQTCDGWIRGCLQLKDRPLGRGILFGGHGQRCPVVFARRHLGRVTNPCYT